jgi:hypothetical protein
MTLHTTIMRLADLLPATSRDQFDPFIDLIDAASVVNDETHYVVDHLGQRMPVSFQRDASALIVDSTRIHLDRTMATFEDGRLTLDDGASLLVLAPDASLGAVRVGQYGLLVAHRDGRGTSVEDALVVLGG